MIEKVVRLERASKNSFFVGAWSLKLLDLLNNVYGVVSI